MRSGNGSRMKKISAGLLLLIGAGLLERAAFSGQDAREQRSFEFVDARAQSREFIGYYESIRLTPEQSRMRDAALSSIPAPCCSRFTMATCCCPCNLAKSVWGLSAYLIAKDGYSEWQVRKKVSEWIEFTNSKGYSGKACFTGGCDRPFREDGCGGMDEKTIY